MTPIQFPEANTNFGPPVGFAETQVHTVPAYMGRATGGSCDGVVLAVVCHQPTPAELKAILLGAPIYLTCLGSLPPHFLTTSFAQATNPA